MAGTLRDCACQKWTGFTAKDIEHAKTMQTMQSFMKYPMVILVIHGDDLTCSLQTYRRCAILMSALMFEKDV